LPQASDAATPAVTSEPRERLLLRRLHALSGVVPLGIFLALHLGMYAGAPAGQLAMEARTSRVRHLPLFDLLELVGVLLPLAYHAAYGIKLTLRPSQPDSSPFSARWIQTMQRVTGVMALAFIGYHLAEYRIPLFLGRTTPEAFYPELVARLSSTVSGVPVVALVYSVGLSSVVVHFATGLWGFFVSWGFLPTGRARALAAAGCGAAAAVLLGLGARGLFYFATGARIFDLGASMPSRDDCDVVDLPPKAPPAKGPAAAETPPR
jgi:succinate dehydrogenase/fumarate reductase cytochrome b subunit (b558 family)